MGWDGSLSANQIQFLDEVINNLTEHGSMDAARLYESPYTDFNPQGGDVFAPAQVQKLLAILEEVRERAVAYGTETWWLNCCEALP